MVWLHAQPRDLARAAVASGRARIPVDAAIWLCCEAVCAVDAVELDDALAAIGVPHHERVPQMLGPWRAQLREGSQWHEPRLPYITMPAALAEEITPSLTQAAVEIAADHKRLSAVLRAEAFAVDDGGRRLRDVLADAGIQIRRSAAACARSVGSEQRR
ncbi:MAG: hypothetical protein QOJ29_4952 [Thermoleophilaceae bacterium]|nr:hypothetical protein [Solirubrobacteraceae bacterium]MEA2497041.1 hypothetical protein [Thermoleophilaceae bacterium]